MNKAVVLGIWPDSASEPEPSVSDDLELPNRPGAEGGPKSPSGSDDYFTNNKIVILSVQPAPRALPVRPVPEVVNSAGQPLVKPPAPLRLIGRQKFYFAYSPEEYDRFYRLLIQLVENASPSADPRRRKELVKFGITAIDLVSELKLQLPFVAQYNPHLSPKTIAHIFDAPNNGHLTRKNYTGLVRARPAQTENDFHEDHPLVRHHSFIFEI